MSNATRPTVHPVHTHLASLLAVLVGLFALALPTQAIRSVPTLDDPSCAAPVIHDLGLGGEQIVPVRGGSVCLRAYLPSTGHWLVAADDAGVSLVPSACASAHDGDTVQRRAAHEIVVDAADAGDRIVCAVGVQSSSLRLTSRFAAGDTADRPFPGKDAFRSPLTDPARLAALCGDASTTLTCAVPLRLRFTTDLRVKTEPDPNCQQPDPDPSCRLHGNVLARAGGGKQAGAAGDGASLFALDIETWSVLDAATTGAADLEVLDAYGRSLGGDDGLHLGPGRYFLRVDGADETEGLNVSVDEAP
ncbi:MAG: hypothetical protein AAGC60_08855 [Acidobacteriota bacterium]